MMKLKNFVFIYAVMVLMVFLSSTFAIDAACTKEGYLESYTWTMYWKDTCDNDEWEFWKNFQLREENGVKKIYNRYGTSQIGTWGVSSGYFDLSFDNGMDVQLDYTDCTTNVSGYYGYGGKTDCQSIHVFMFRGNTI